MTLDNYREEMEKHRRSEEQRDAIHETPYSPGAMRPGIPWGCLAVLIVLGIAAVKLALWGFRKFAQ